MKIFKKTGTGLAFLLLALTAVFLTSHKYALADVAPGDIAGATYSFQDRGNIIGDFGTSGKVAFTDPNPFDGTRNYVPSQGGFCDPGTINSQNGVPGNIKFGINIASGANLSSGTIAAQVKLGYLVGNNCKGVLEKISISNPQTPVPVAAATFEWDGQNITTFPGETDKTLTFTAASSQNNSPLYFSNQLAGNCPQNGAIILTDGTNQGTYYTFSGITLSPRGGPTPSENLSNYPLLNQTGSIDATKCHVDSASNITISGTQGTQATGGPNTTTQTGSDDSSCEANAGSPLAWLMCPLFSAASAIVQSTVNIFESLLSFTVAQDLGNAQCKINNQGCQASVKLTWSIIKNVASIILVIVLLVMVFSQAIGGGPFDAYTIRKLLPKLVAAVIIMQLSWPLVAWVIDIFNDIGNGLQDFLFAPFGGTSSLNDLGKLISHAGISTAGAAAFNWVVILGAGVATVAALPAALFLAFASIVGLLVGIITLIFRKILIIMLLILSPIAIIAWVLPGTQKYWKLWSDSLLKALAMYPLIVALIAAGRIFAYIAGPQTSGFDGFAASFLALLFVLVGFIGPLFILPRTFRWGGSMMAAAGGAIAQAGARVNKGAEQPLKGYAERKQGQWAKKYDPQAGIGSRVLRRIQSGNVLPTKRSQRLAIAAGDKWQQERDEEALALINRKGEKAREGYDAIVRDDEGRMLDSSGNVTTDESRAARRRLNGVAAMKQMWVDLAENGRDDHEKKMAIKKLIATSSWPEVQGSFTASGKRVIDTEAWRNAVTTSEEDYPKVLRSRVDAAPHIIDAANNAVLAENQRRIQAGETAMSDIEARNYASAYRINYAIDKQMSNEDFASQSDGFWQETERMANLKDSRGRLTEQARSIRANLKNRFQAIHDIGGTAPAQLLGHLASGGSLEATVNNALGDVNVREYIKPGGEVKVTPQIAETPSGRTYETGNVEGGQRSTEVTRDNILNMSPDNLANWVQSKGGYENMSNQDLTVIYNVRRDNHQRAAAEVLQRRGVMNPSGEQASEVSDAPQTPPEIIIPSVYRPRAPRDDEGTVDIQHGNSPESPDNRNT